MREPNIWKNKDDFYLKVLEEPWYGLLVKLENLITFETMKFYEKKGIITIHLPITTGTISSPMGRGSDSIPVKVKINGKDTYLADSMQFLLEYGCRLNSKGVFYVMPSFRGENTDERHLNQFYHSEVEIPGKLEDIISLGTEYIKYLSKKILEYYGDELRDKIGNISHIKKIANYKGEFPKITFDEAEKQIKKLHPNDIEKYIQYEDGWRNLTRNAEKELIGLYDGVVWITNYDELAVPFYQQDDDVLKGTTRNADLLIGIGETIGCGERFETGDGVLNSLEKHEVDPNEYEWYINMKKIYPMKTSGFGMGIERFLLWVLNATDIRNMQICWRLSENGEECKKI